MVRFRKTVDPKETKKYYHREHRSKKNQRSKGKAFYDKLKYHKAKEKLKLQDLKE